MNVVGFCRNIENVAQERHGSLLARFLSLRDDHVFNKNLVYNSILENVVDDNISNPLSEILIAHLKCVKVTILFNIQMHSLFSLL